MSCIKKTISILLSFTMVLSFFTFAPLNVAAEEISDQLIQQETVDGVLQEDPGNASDAELFADSEITSWSALQQRINTAQNGDTIRLTRNLTATGDDHGLIIPSYRNLTIDLAGCTLNRGLVNSYDIDTGYVIYVQIDAQLTLINTGDVGEATIMGGNNTYDGGGIFNRGTLIIGRQTDTAAIRIKDNNASYGAGIFNTGTIEMNGAILFNNDAGSSGGAIYNNGNRMTIKGGSIYSNRADISGGGIYNDKTEMTLAGASIWDNNAKVYGGGICNIGSLTIEYGRIYRNHASYGGGIYVQGTGTTTIEEGDIDLNIASKDGGGIYVNQQATLRLGFAPSIHENVAGNNAAMDDEDDEDDTGEKSYHGGGVYVGGTLELTGGQPTVYSNNSALYANNNITWIDNIYLPEGKRINVSGRLLGGTLSVTLESGTGQVTEGFSANGNMVARFFKGDGYFAADRDGEVWLQEEEVHHDFMNPIQLAKPSEVDGTNWMAAIPGEWDITQFNIPYSHDSATWNISPTRVIGGTAAQAAKEFGWEYAKTQWHTVPEQLQMGVRVLDVRMNNYCPYDGTATGSKWMDDFQNLWVCHGRDSTGTYFAINEDDSVVSVAQVLGHVKEFLTQRPTETVVILFTVESQDYDDVHDMIFKRLKDHLQELADEINPSTGKPYLYCEPGQGFFDPYTHVPRLGDCRGQLVIEYDSDTADQFIGGMYGMGGIGYVMPGGTITTMREPGNNSVLADEKIKNLYSFMNEPGNWHPLAKDATTHFDHFYFMSPSTHTPRDYDYALGTNKPLALASRINAEFFDTDNAFFKQNGIYFGWVKMDGIRTRYANRIWQSNFTGDDYLDHCKVTVVSDLDKSLYPNQDYSIVKGSTITFPECIYDYNSKETGDFVGWEMQESGSDEKTVFLPAETAVISSDVTITAKWGKISRDQLQVHLDPGADDVVMDEGQRLVFLSPLGVTLNMKKMNQANRPGYTLDGWYTQDGVKIEDSTRLRISLCDKNDTGAVVLTDPDRNGFAYQRLTLTAHWNEEQVVQFAIKTGENIPAGAIVTDYQTAPAGTLITVTVNPVNGFNWEQQRILDSNGKQIDITKTGDNTYTFMMPAADVTIQADEGGGEAVVYHKVTFDKNNGEGTETQFVAHGATATPFEPAAPDDDSIFIAWYEMLTHGRVARNPFDFRTPINKDLTLKAFFADAHGAGSYVRYETLDEAPIISGDIEDGLIGNYLTQEELDEGFGLLVISSPYVGSDVPQADKDTLTALIAKLGASSGVWFDISLYKVKNVHFGLPSEMLDRDGTEKLPSVSVPVELTAYIPESLQKNGRTYYLLSSHDDQAELVAQGNDTMFSWESDKFSTYLIAYKDSVSWSGGSTGTAATKYKVALPDDLSNGSVKSSAEKAKKGEKVTITVTPDEGYQTTAVNVTDENGEKIEVTDNGDGTYTFTMPATEVTITPVFTENQKPDKPGEQACPRDDTCPITPFTDTDKNEWYHDGVHWALENAVMNGTSANTFEPLAATTRAMIVTMLWRMVGSPQTDGTVTFKDVPDGQWYTDAIRWAASNDIVNGYDEDTFGTNDSVTREQLATVLYRCAQSKGKGFTGTWAFPLNFDDADQVSEWADEAMHWMTMNGIIQGMSEKELSPQGDAVRAQVATMLMRFCEKLQA